MVLILNMRAETLKEEVTVGLAQAKVLDDLRKAAAGTAHRLGLYYTVPESKDGKEPERATYIHAKVMIVDDRLRNVGSANLTNRSCSVDTELNATYECASKTDALGSCIRAIRLNLLAEHLGVTGRELSFEEGRVDRLDDRAQRRDRRLRPHPSPTERERAIIEVLDPQTLPFDPHGVEEEDDRPLFANGIDVLWRRISAIATTRSERPRLAPFAAPGCGNGKGLVPAYAVPRGRAAAKVFASCVELSSSPSLRPPSLPTLARATSGATTWALEETRRRALLPFLDPRVAPVARALLAAPALRVAPALRA